MLELGLTKSTLGPWFLANDGAPDLMMVSDDMRQDTFGFHEIASAPRFDSTRVLLQAKEGKLFDSRIVATARLGDVYEWWDMLTSAMANGEITLLQLMSATVLPVVPENGGHKPIVNNETGRVRLINYGGDVDFMGSQQRGTIFPITSNYGNGYPPVNASDLGLTSRSGNAINYTYHRMKRGVRKLASTLAKASSSIAQRLPGYMHEEAAEILAELGKQNEVSLTQIWSEVYQRKSLPESAIDKLVGIIDDFGTEILYTGYGLKNVLIPTFHLAGLLRQSYEGACSHMVREGLLVERA